MKTNDTAMSFEFQVAIFFILFTSIFCMYAACSFENLFVFAKRCIILHMQNELREGIFGIEFMPDFFSNVSW